jgi:CHAT domain
MGQLYYEVSVDESGIIRAGVNGREIKGTLDLEALKSLENDLSQIKVNDTSPNSTLTNIGLKLYSTLFPTQKYSGMPVSIREDFSAYYKGALEGKDRLSIILRIDHDYAQALPWELIHDGNYFLGPQNNVSVIRMPLAIPGNASKQLPKTIDDKIRIVVILSTPVGQEPLAFARLEYEKIKEIWQNQNQLPGKVEMHTISSDLAIQDRPTLQNIVTRIDEIRPHIVHYIGHSAFINEKGTLFLSNPDGSSKAVDEVDFAGQFIGERLANLALVILNSCESGSQVGFNGIAKRLVERGVPCVVAMQFGIFDHLAPQFASDFYAKFLSSGFSVEDAINNCRQMHYVGNAGPNMIEFAAPVLYMASVDNKKIFRISGEGPVHGRPVTDSRTVTVPKPRKEATVINEQNIIQMVTKLIDTYSRMFPRRISHSEFFYSPDKGNLKAILIYFVDNAEKLNLTDNETDLITDTLTWVPVRLERLGRPGNNDDQTKAELNQLYNRIILFMKNYRTKYEVNTGGGDI